MGRTLERLEAGLGDAAKSESEEIIFRPEICSPFWQGLFYLIQRSGQFHAFGLETAMVGSNEVV
jgi:hypothetical protein